VEERESQNDLSMTRKYIMLYQRLLGDSSGGSHEFLPGREEESQDWHGSFTVTTMGWNRRIKQPWFPAAQQVAYETNGYDCARR